MWFSSLGSNFGTLVLTVGAAWTMTELSGKADMIALVQSAIFLPYLLLGLVAGVLADTFDRRLVAIYALSISLFGASLLVVVSMAGLLSAWLLLALCFVVGCGNALLGPAWQTSVAEQVEPIELSRAIMLNSVSFNLARSAGPAIGGLIVATTGTLVAFITTIIGFIPITLVFILWKRQPSESRLPREPFYDAMGNGLRYIAHAPPIKVAIFRALIFGMLASVLPSMAPVIATDVLTSGVNTYGALLASFGVGAIITALSMNKVKRHLTAEQGLRLATLILGLACILLVFSRHPALSMLGYFVSGGAYMAGVNLFNVSVQLQSSRWVSARTLAVFNSTIAGSLAVGSWLWGQIAVEFGIIKTFEIASLSLVLSYMLGWLLPLADLLDSPIGKAVFGSQREFPVTVDNESGPIIVEIHYRIPEQFTAKFLQLMNDVASSRARNGAREWSVSQMLDDPERWLQRFELRNWREYLHFRERSTTHDRSLYEQVKDLHQDMKPIEVFVRLARQPG